MNWLMTVLGLNDPSGVYYLFWSGFGSDLSYFGVLALVYRHIKCKHCWRIGRHPLAGTHYRICHHHVKELS